jgi:peptide/nickel transport system permease protein
MVRHLVRNASLPMVTLIGLSLPIFLAGNLITESVFNYQGLGSSSSRACRRSTIGRCSPTPSPAPSWSSSGNLVADIALAIADPRIRLA